VLLGEFVAKFESQVLVVDDVELLRKFLDAGERLEVRMSHYLGFVKREVIALTFYLGEFAKLDKFPILLVNLSEIELWTFARSVASDQ
jgi:hypothetical protein